MFEYADEPYFEEYIFKGSKPVRLKLYLPIQRRSEETKITLIGNPNLRFATAKAKGHNAEEIASRKVIEYLSAHYRHTIDSLTEFYVYKEENSCVCGVMLNSEFLMTEDEHVVQTDTGQGNYLLLESNVMGDYHRYAELLLSFAWENGMKADKSGVFAVYDASESFVNLKIKMYCPVNIRKK